MRDSSRSSLSWWRRLVLTGIAAVGLVAIVASGGGDAPECSFFSNVCNPGGGTFPPIAVASVYPRTLTVQVGGTMLLTADWTGIDNPSFQWSRSPDGGISYVNIAGATGSSYTLAGARLTDDGVVFRVDIGNGTVSAHAASILAVSSMPGVVYQDGDFVLSDWTVSAIADPAVNGPTHSEERAASGGNPDAYRSMVHTMPAGPSSLNVLHTYQAGTYDPSSQGAIYVIDYTEDCIRLDTSSSNYLANSNLLIEQGARKYTGTGGARSCYAALWSTLQPSLASLHASDFTLVDGPSCGVGESCPDFSDGAVPLHFGFARRTTLAAGLPAGSVMHGIDNWKVTVWRR